MNQTQKGVLIAILVVLLGGGAYYAWRHNADALKDAAGKAADTASATAKQASNMVDLGATVDKSSRLIADAGAATLAMKDLFTDDKVPDQAAIDAARGKIEAALSGVTGIEIPAGAEGAAADMLKKAKDNAARALEIVKALPKDAAGILAALDNIQAALSGKPVESAAPAAAAPAAATQTDAAKTGEAPAAPAAASTGQDAAPAATPANATTTESATAQTAPAQPTEAFPAVPRFDLLRVEPDGSTVIAGQAAEGAKVEILDGDAVVSTTEAGAGGDFAAVFENPLSPGDHQLTLKATGKDGKTTLSEEVATVSVPKEPNGELLAMVSKPGEASRVITAPGTKTPASQETAAATPAAAPAATADANAAGAATETGAPAPQADAGVKAALQISAVELEGDRIFVAGTADPKSKVIAYADDKKIGESATGDDGHFVVDGVLPLSVGSHKIRVDQEGSDGKIAFRAEVPFDRPEGEQVAAVATPGATDAAATGSPLQPLGDGAFDQRRAEAVKAFGLLEKLYADGKTPTAEEFAAARSATVIALQSLADFTLPAGADEASRQMVATTRENALKALAILKALPDSGANAGAELARIGELIGKTVSPAGAAVAPVAGGTEPAPATEPAADEAPAKALSAATEAAKPAAPEASSQEPTKVEQAPLTGSKNTVIIRKGDTLWQISRRVYGLGVRYTTIYLANREQIRNPDRILPGQVFGVPDKALPNAEELHKQRLHGQKIQ
ncbi:LysM peptidoglycan-binding domain-containing protein [Gellertiella hungarica]|uniref:Nucleoid-associated protein YgaU n=1 Tax=Gellertiella hungarica TaxID=1572859 RepID=A0A7W6J6C6_9HYPH|nr:LysM peptidoglycan-binding domain-containing protein [Gellertiella hungarica]MBB4065579.1 nucleoid-associated protein YgaU [Gellertiella hungarica]